MLGKMKDLYNLQKQAKQIKKDLQKTHIQAEVDGVTVTLNAEMDLVNVEIAPEALENAAKLEKSIMEAFKKAKKKAEQIAAEKMKEMMGGGMPGLEGLMGGQ